VASFSHAISQHKNTPENNADTPFEFSEENKAKFPALFAKYPKNRKQSAVIPMLQMAQKQNDNWLPLSAMNEVARLLDIPPIRVYEVATFYTMFNREPMAKYHLQVCGTTHCLVCGADKIIDTISKHLNIKLGETTPDNMFVMTEVECLGACVNAPMLQVNNEWFYENLDEENVIKVIEGLRNNDPNLKPGPQIEGLRDCEGPQGQTNLLDAENLPPPPCRDFDALRAELEEKANLPK